VLKADKKAIFTAAAKASEATAFLAALQPLPTRNAGMR
jgi:antirestriction protein ArdC